jgi:hypothetical protein
VDLDNEMRAAIRSRNVRATPMLYRMGKVEEALDIMLDSPGLAMEALTKARAAVSVLTARGDTERAQRFQAIVNKAQEIVNYWAERV